MLTLFALLGVALFAFLISAIRLSYRLGAPQVVAVKSQFRHMQMS